MFQTRVVFVRRQVNPVEARMTLRQLRRIARLFDGEPPRPIGALQVLEPIDRYPRRARRELQQTTLALRRPAPHTLPEPLHNLVADLVATVVRELGPVIAVWDS